MARKRRPTPSLFCEWVVGTTIPAALGSLPKKTPTRDVVTVEVVTDDETEQDTLKITYPRSGRSKGKEHAKKTMAKKVRFGEDATKSAMKKTSTPSQSSKESVKDSGAGAPSDSTDSKHEESETRNSSESNENSQDTASDLDLPGKKGKGRKKTQRRAARFSNQRDDSEPHPTCECRKCVRGRQKRKKREEVCFAESEPSDSEIGEAKAKERIANEKKKTKSVRQDRDSEDKSEMSESSGESKSSDSETEKQQLKEEKKSQRQSKTKRSKNKMTNKEEGQGCGAEFTGLQTNNGKRDEEKKPEVSDQEAHDKETMLKTKLHSGLPEPHPRRPNLIEPIRAEVVHTERVVEAPEDPPPNAYYDAENKIVRVYYGPVYGRHGLPLYPKRNPSSTWPPPVSMPYPLYNSCYHGLERLQDKNGVGHVPATPLMPTPAWSAHCPPPPGPPATYPNFAPTGHTPWPIAMPANHDNRGAFHKYSPAEAAEASASSSKDQVAAGGDNNIFPPSKVNPYLPKKNRSPFSNFGSNKTASNASPRNQKASQIVDNQNGSHPPGQTEWGNVNAQDITQAAWENTISPGDAWPSDAAGATDQNQQGSDWPAEAPNSGGAGAWDNGQNGHTDNAHWNTGNGDSGQAASDPPRGNDNMNVMPGGWGSPTGVGFGWADPTIAASTGGQVDTWP